MALENTTPLNAVKIEVTNDYVSIDGFTTTSREVISAFQSSEHDDNLRVLEQILKVGAETVKMMGTSATTEILENVAESVKNEINNVAKQLVSESGELSVKEMLSTWRGEFATLLGDSFDAKRTDSILSKFDVAIKTWSETQQQKILDELNLNNESSAFSGLKNNISKLIRDNYEPLREHLVGIEKALDVNKANKDSKKKQVSKGTDFEDLVFDAVEEISISYRDIVDNPGKRKESGVDGNNEGDITVDLNRDETSGDLIRFVWECKLRSAKQSALWLYKELEKGISNREAKAGVIVVDETTAGGSAEDNEFFRENGNMAILVLDPENIDSNSIKFAYLWSRWMSRRDDSHILNVGGVKEVLDSIRRELSVIRSVKSHHTAVTREIGFAIDKVDHLEKSVKSQLDKLEAMIQLTDVTEIDTNLPEEELS
jgi:hypothetical protein